MTYWLEQAEAEQQSSLYASVTNRLINIAVHELQRVGVSSGSKVRVPGASPARLKYLQEQTKSLRCREEALRATKSVLRETSTEQVMQVHCDEGVAIQIGAKVPARAWTKRPHGYAQASHRAAKVASNRVPIAALLAEGNTEGCVNTSAWTWSQTLACAETP